MDIIFTDIDTSYACSELGRAIVKAFPGIKAVANEFRSRTDERTLVVVMNCPCCSSGGKKFDPSKAVMVTPMRGIDAGGREVMSVSLYPPFRTPGEDGEALTIEEYLDDFRKVIEKALG